MYDPEQYEKKKRTGFHLFAEGVSREEGNRYLFGLLKFMASVFGVILVSCIVLRFLILGPVSCASLNSDRKSVV